MSTRNAKVDHFIETAGKWQAEYKKLRDIVLDCGLTEELKWGVPCYTLEGSNIVLMHGFKHYCALLFVKGALMEDPKRILIQQTPDVQAGRQVRFTNGDEIDELEPVLKVYIRNAIAVEKAGLKVIHKKTEEYAVAEEFQRKLAENPALKAAFEALTPGRQRGYLFFFSAPKLAKTREERVEKSLPLILAGKGLND